MMGKTVLKVLVLMIMSTFIFSCAAQKPMTAFDPMDLNAKLRTGEYVQKVNSFMVIVDASGSMAGAKLDTAKDIVSRLNKTIPDIKLTGAMRRFGLGDYISGSPTALLYGPTDYTKEGLEGGLTKIHYGNGNTPMGMAVNAAGEDLKNAPGNMALIIVSDAVEQDMDDPVLAADRIKQAYGDRICIYPIFVGDDPAGKVTMDKVGQTGKCGFVVSAGDVSSREGMAGFVERVFLAKAVKAEPPTPPPAPKVVAPPKAPSPMDSDGDGVFDNEDQCPGTPRGAEVNKVGCWVLKNVQFDFDKWNIKPIYIPELNKAVNVLKMNHGLKLEVQGHTDNIGTETYNLGLSKKRAAAVVEYLVKQGVDRDRLMPEGYGFSKPVSSNKTDEGRAQNRRVQLNPVK